MSDLGMDLTVALQNYRDERRRRLISTAELDSLIDRLASPESIAIALSTPSATGEQPTLRTWSGRTDLRDLLTEVLEQGQADKTLLVNAYRYPADDPDGSRGAHLTAYGLAEELIQRAAALAATSTEEPSDE